jgi:hypothetical protein
MTPVPTLAVPTVTKAPDQVVYIKPPASESAVLVKPEPKPVVMPPRPGTDITTIVKTIQGKLPEIIKPATTIQSKFGSLGEMLSGLVKNVITAREDVGKNLTALNNRVALATTGQKAVLPYQPKELSAIKAPITSGDVSPVLSASPSKVAAAISGDQVNFSPFVIRLWSKRGGGLLTMSQLQGGLSDSTLTIGRYILTFRAPLQANPPFVSIDGANIPISVGGKSVVIEKVRIADYKEGEAYRELKLQVNIIQNPIPILALVAAAAAAIGLGAWGLSDALDSVDKVVVNTTSSVLQIVVVGGVAFLGYWFLIRKKGRKAAA